MMANNPPSLSSSGDAENSSVSVKKVRNQAEVIIERLQNSNGLFFHDQNHDAYISIDGTGRKIIKLNSKEFELWLHHFIYRRMGRMVVSISAIKQVSNVMAALAVHDGPQLDLNVRIARDKDGIWYDLGGPAVRITDEGWRVVDNPPILFKSFSHQLPQIAPVRGGSVLNIFDFMSAASDEDKVLIIAFLVTAFFPDLIRPILVVHGTQGSGKTTQLKIIKELIDPSRISGVGLPKKQEDLIQLVDHHAFIFFDNARFVSQESSDYLSQIITGISLNKRELFTNDGDYFFTVKRPLAINSIGQVVEQPDLLQRSIIIRVKPIPSATRISDTELWTKFNQHKPEILGGVFDCLVRTLQTYKDVELPKLPRMADFAIYGYAAAEACGIKGSDFLKAYSDNIVDQNNVVMEAQPVAEALVHYLQNFSCFGGTPAEWLKLANNTAHEIGLDTGQASWPKNPSRFGKLLPSIMPLLEAKGIYRKEMPRGHDRTIILYKKIDQFHDAADDATPSEPVYTEQMAGQLSLITEVFGEVESLSSFHNPFDGDITSGTSAK